MGKFGRLQCTNYWVWKLKKIDLKALKKIIDVVLMIFCKETNSTEIKVSTLQLNG